MPSFSRRGSIPNVKVKFTEIERNNYCTGETVTGVIKIDSKAWCTLSSLRVFIIGKEDCYRGDYVKQRTIGSRNTITIARHTRLDPGIYTYPFEFSIPSSLEPSVASPGSFNSTYSLRVQLRLSKYKALPITDSFLVYIHKPPARLLAPTFNSKLQRGIIHKDRAFITCLPASQTLQLYEALKIDVSIRNETRKDITRLIVSLEQTVAKHKQRKEISFVYQTDLMLHIAPDHYVDNILAFLVEEKVGLQIPATYFGVKVSVDYSIVFTLEFEGGGEWTTRMPIKVRSAPFGIKQRQGETPLTIPGWEASVISAKAKFERKLKNFPLLEPVAPLSPPPYVAGPELLY